MCLMLRMIKVSFQLVAIFLVQSCACAVSTEAIFKNEELDFEAQYWHCLSSVLACLDFTLEHEKLTEAMSESLCQLSKLEILKLSAEGDRLPHAGHEAVINLNLPLLKALSVHSFGPASI